MGGDGQVLLTVRRYYRCISAKVLKVRTHSITVDPLDSLIMRGVTYRVRVNAGHQTSDRKSADIATITRTIPYTSRVEQIANIKSHQRANNE